MKLAVSCIDFITDLVKLADDSAVVAKQQLLVDSHSMVVDFDNCLEEFPIFHFLKQFSQHVELQRQLQFHLNIA